MTDPRHQEPHVEAAARRHLRAGAKILASKSVDYGNGAALLIETPEGQRVSVSGPVFGDCRGFANALRAIGLALAVLASIALPAIAAGPDCSGTITSGGSAQVLIAAGNLIHGLQIQNLSTDRLAFSDKTATPAVATNGSWTLDAGTGTTSGGSWIMPLGYPIGASAIYIIGATNGDKFTCSWW